MSVDFSSTIGRLNLQEFSQITWKTAKDIGFLSQNFHELSDSERSTLEGRGAQLNQLVKDYSFTLCNLIWSIISFSFCFFKMRRLKDSLVDLSDAKEGDDLKKEESQLIPQKIQILTRAIELIEKDYTDPVTTPFTVKKVKKIFEDKMAKLEKNEDTPVGIWLHATERTRVGKIIRSGRLIPGQNKAYGEGVYVSSQHETGRGDFVFAFDHAVLSKKTGVYTVFSTCFPLKTKWIAIKGNVRLSHRRVMIYAPNNQVDKVKKMMASFPKFLKVEVYLQSEGNLISKYYHDAMEELHLAEVPIGFENNSSCKMLG